jgi:hypothetical protein
VIVVNEPTEPLHPGWALGVLVTDPLPDPARYADAGSGSISELEHLPRFVYARVIARDGEPVVDEDGDPVVLDREQPLEQWSDPATVGDEIEDEEPPPFLSPKDRGAESVASAQTAPDCRERPWRR